MKVSQKELSMLIIADHRLPEEAKSKLRKEGELLEFKTPGVVYDAISGHPDIFMCQTSQQLILSPQTPREIVESLTKHSIKFTFGRKNTGFNHPETSHYNAVVAGEFLIHNLKFTDTEILQTSDNSKRIHINQGYTGCNLLPLGKNHFITSDEGIYKTLKSRFNILYVSPKGILLKNFEHGFIGGTAGFLDNKVFFAGSLKHFPEGNRVSGFLHDLDFDIIELCDGPLIDGGGIFFCNDS